MPTAPNAIRNEPWLESPLRTGMGELQLAGELQNVHGLDPKAMRVLGSYSLIYMLSVDGYYCDANGGRADLRTGDVILSVAGGPVVDLATFYKRLWALGPAGVEAPLAIVRDGRKLDVTVRTADRARMVNTPRLH